MKNNVASIFYKKYFEINQMWICVLNHSFLR